MQTIYVFWRFEFAEIEIKKTISNNKKIIFIKYPCSLLGANEVFNDYKSLKCEPDADLILIHDKPNNEDLLTNWSKKYKGIIETFGGADGIIYTEFNLLNFNVKDNYNEQQFNNVWDEYSIKKKLERQKKEFINLWLPLAIDIQGLSEVQNETKKAAEYFEKIKKEKKYLVSLETFQNNEDGKNEHFIRWEEIKNELKNGYDTFDYKDLADKLLKNNLTTFLNNTNYLKVEKEETEELKKLKDEVDDLRKNNKQQEFEKMKKELEEKMKNPNFFPNWLQEVVSVLDSKIKATSSESSNE